MSRPRLLLPVIPAVVATAAASVAGAGSVAAAQQRPTPDGSDNPAAAVSLEPRLDVVATGLDNPRGISEVAPGRFLVAESGRGGPRCVDAVFVGPQGPTKQCAGRTAAVTELRYGKQRRVVTGLPSVAGPDGSGASGANDVSLHRGRLSVALGEIEGDVSAEFGSLARRFATLAETRRQRTQDRRGSSYRPVRQVADLEAFEEAVNPDGGRKPDGSPELEANPHSVIDGGRRRVVPDAGANTLLSVRRDGQVSVLAVFPPQLVPTDGVPVPNLPRQIPAQSVPTSVAVGPEGAYYVGELTGFPFVQGRARVWRVVEGKAPRVVATGFTNIIDIAFDRRGRLHVLELAKDGLLAAGPQGPVGRLVRVERNGRRTELAAELPAPGGVAPAFDGSVYVTTNTLSAGNGQVVRIRP